MQTEIQETTSKILFEAMSQELEEGRNAVFTVTGMSMYPFLRHRTDQVYIRKVPYADLKEGDIILTAHSDKDYILHRITNISDDMIQTTGDHNLFRDPLVSSKHVVGKVYQVKRQGKIISCDKFLWKASGVIWMKLFPIRKYLFRFWFAIRKYVRR